MKMKWKILFSILLVIGLMMFAVAAMADGSSTVVNGTVPLLISNVASSTVTSSGATITWNTNGISSSQVFYDTVSHPTYSTIATIGGYASKTTVDPTLVTTHSVNLTSLSPSTTYYYRVESTATIGGNPFTAISDEYSFKTLASTAKLGTMTIILNASPEPSTYGQSVTFNAMVLSTWFQGVPTGKVNFMEGTTLLGTGTLGQLGLTSFSISSLAIGKHNITAVYAGDNTFAGSTSSAWTHTVNKANASVVLAPNINPSVYSQSVTFTATVTGASGTPSGKVQFAIDGANSGSAVTLSAGGTAAISTNSLTVGSHNITASYSGDTNYNSSTSNTVKQTVNKVTAAIVLSSGTNPSVFGQPVTFTAVFTPGTATGSVTFKEGNTTLGTGTIKSGVATFTTNSLSVASHSITATYSGDTNDSSATSNTVTQVVGKASSKVTVTSSVTPSVWGQSVTFTATVSALSPGAGTPSGTVQFQIDGVNFGSAVTLSGGSATSIATKTMAVGNHIITAIYSGNANFTTGLGSVGQTVKKANTTTSLNTSNSSIRTGRSVTFTATISVSSPGSGTPGGTVTFFDGSTTLGTGTVSGGKATFSTSTLSIRTHTITAMYNGDGNFNGSSDNVLQRITSN
jgi:Bacterial Ig-like domain (group 3)/Purple acid Phosphatase, N-terminal domain